MKTLLLALLLVASAAFADCPPPSAAPTPAEREAAAAQDRGMLWRLRREGRDSYLFASLHLGRAAWTQPGPALRRAWSATDTLALELDISDPKTIAALVQAVPQPKTPLPAPLLERLDTQARAACIPPPALAPLHPLLRLTTLTMMAARWDGLDPSFGQEALLLGLAHGQSRRIVALETPEDQLRALIPDDDAELRAALAEGLDLLEAGQVRAPIRKLADAWARGDDATLAGYEQWCDCVKTERDRRWLQRLNEGRNPQIAAGIAAQHAQGRRVLAAVGALHMTGPRGLPALLGQMGFEVTRIH